MRNWLGPTKDGGYYLIGMQKRLDAGIFSDVEWSTSGVFSKTMQNAEGLKKSVHILPEYFDIDNAEDLIHIDALKEELSHVAGN